MNKKITPKLKAVIMATTKNGKVPAKVAKEDPKAVDKLKDEGLAKTQKGPNGKAETVLTKAGKEAKAKAQDPEKAKKTPPHKDATPKRKLSGKPGKNEAEKPEKSSNTGKEKPKIRQDTKQYTILKLLSRPQGATIQQLHEATGWKLTTLRGTPGALKLKLGLEIKSEKRDGEDTVYRIVGGLDGLL